ncbi:unnamed protein product [marine sediment metagenome]|uniref:Uncharacterized protein n=1 Tax=marine sediment metagenome TaxID=412755 RepID=X1HP79_9ZZZZ
METKTRLQICLLFLRITVFLVIFMWTLDKFVNPAHAAAVYKSFYLIGGLGPVIMYVIWRSGNDSFVWISIRHC